MPQATVKKYDSLTKTGSLLADDGTTEYVIDPTSIETGMFRFLRPGQRITFEIEEQDGRRLARNLRIGVA
ncbi:MAG: cold shock domain-containing protein [Actinomycetota bacterium]|nr:cold shock domain-containing protein [Actinomycetota bacterium]